MFISSEQLLVHAVRIVAENQPTGGVVSLLLLGIALLPIAGIPLFGWQLSEALFVYWLEIGLFMSLYTGLILFAGQAPRPDERAIDLATIPIPLVSGRSGTVQPIGRLPPIYHRNVRYAAGFLPFGLFFWFASAYLLLAHADPAVRLETGDGRGVPVTEYLDVVTAAYTPEALWLALALFGVRLAVVRREFFGRRLYERVSAPVLVGVPLRIGVLWMLLVAVATISLPFVVLPLLHDFGTAPVTEAWVLVLAVSGKFAMERGAFEARRGNDPDGPIRWLTPEHVDSDS